MDAVREHIDRSDLAQLISTAAKFLKVSGKSCRIAADIDDPCRRGRKDSA